LALIGVAEGGVGDLPKLTGRSRLDLVAVKVCAVIIFGAAPAFGIWATITRNSALFGRLTALAGLSPAFRNGLMVHA
jgi:hypothetical protein